MRKFNVCWQKRYYLTGTKEVEASSPEEAIWIMRKLIGDMGKDDGSMALDDSYEEVTCAQILGNS